MEVQTLLRDCLYLNWALPAEAAPDLPAELRYQTHEEGGRRFVFASAVLFRQQGLHFSALPLVKLSHPQANFRLYVEDEDGVPSVFFLRMLMPAWMLPAVWFGRQPAAPARFRFPDHVGGDERSWKWTVEAGEVLEVEARLGAGMVGEGPRFSSWEASVTYFRHRLRGYHLAGKQLRRFEAHHPRTEVLPVTAQVHQAGLVRRELGVTLLPALHSAILCSELAITFELALGFGPREIKAPVVAGASRDITSL